MQHRGGRVHVLMPGKQRGIRLTRGEDIDDRRQQCLGAFGLSRPYLSRDRGGAGLVRVDDRQRRHVTAALQAAGVQRADSSRAYQPNVHLSLPALALRSWERSHGNVPASILRLRMMSRAPTRKRPPAPARVPTIIDVAGRAGLSKSVASRVMRGEASVSEASRSAVLAAAEELGYRANAVARSLVQRKTYNVGVMVSDLHNIFFAEVLDGLYAAAAELGYRALIPTRSEERRV